jgi:hypothetical protein
MIKRNLFLIILFFSTTIVVAQNIHEVSLEITNSTPLDTIKKQNCPNGFLLQINGKDQCIDTTIMYYPSFAEYWDELDCCVPLSSDSLLRFVRQ